MGSIVKGLFGGGEKKNQTVTSQQSVPEWQLPYLQQGLAEALRIYQGGGLPYAGGYQPGMMNPPMPQQMPPATAQPAPTAGRWDWMKGTLPEGGGVDGRNDRPASNSSRPQPAAPVVPGSGAMGPPAGGPPPQQIQSGIFQGPTVAGLSSATRAGINAIAANAGGIDPKSSVNALVSALNGNAFGLQDTAAGNGTGFGQATTAAGGDRAFGLNRVAAGNYGSFGLRKAAQGDYLNANPYLDANINAATRGITDSFRRTTAPGIESAAASRGRLGSGWDAMNRRQASESVAQELGDVESGMRADNYARERQLQQQAQGQLGQMQLGAQQFMSGQQQNAQQFMSGQQQAAQQAMVQQRLQAAGLLPQVLDTANQSALRGGAALMGAGQYVDANNTARMQDAAQRYERTMAEPMDRLARYMQVVSGNFGGTSTETKPIYRDTAGGLLGGIGAGAKIGGLFGSSGLGAIGGGILGLLSDETTKRKRKKAKSALDALDKVEIDEWEYKPGYADNGQARHIGIMAQDFKRATGYGDGRTIPVVDALGVSMKAAKELAERVRRLEKRAA